VGISGQDHHGSHVSLDEPGTVPAGIDPGRAVDASFKKPSLTGVLGGSGNVAFYLALAGGGKASIVVPLVGLAPLVTVVLALVILKESLTKAQVAGLGVALISIYLLSI
jgi:drug/metabolite transporter (DMT)-like permease